MNWPKVCDLLKVLSMISGSVMCAAMALAGTVSHTFFILTLGISGSVFPISLFLLDTANKQVQKVDVYKVKRVRVYDSFGGFLIAISIWSIIIATTAYMNMPDAIKGGLPAVMFFILGLLALMIIGSTSIFLHKKHRYGCYIDLPFGEIEWSDVYGALDLEEKRSNTGAVLPFPTHSREGIDICIHRSGHNIRVKVGSTEDIDGKDLLQKLISIKGIT